MGARGQVEEMRARVQEARLRNVGRFVASSSQGGFNHHCPLILLWSNICPPSTEPQVQGVQSKRVVMSEAYGIYTFKASPHIWRRHKIGHLHSFLPPPSHLDSGACRRRLSIASNPKASCFRRGILRSIDVYWTAVCRCSLFSSPCMPDQSGLGASTTSYTSPSKMRNPSFNTESSSQCKLC